MKFQQKLASQVGQTILPSSCLVGATRSVMQYEVSAYLPEVAVDAPPVGPVPQFMSKLLLLFMFWLATKVMGLHL
jgi:hypothetical protein